MIGGKPMTIAVGPSPALFMIAVLLPAGVWAADPAPPRLEKKLNSRSTKCSSNCRT